MGTGTSLAVNTNGVGHGHGPPALMSIDDMERVADKVIAGGLFPEINTREAAFTLMMICQSEGINPIEAFRRYHIIDGKPSKRADAQHAEFQAKGGTLRWVQTDATVCEATFSHPVLQPEPLPIRVTMRELIDREVATSWKKDDGGNWKKVLKTNYQKYPASMLRARVITEGVRAVFPGIVTGIYSPEEIDDMRDEDRPSYAAVTIVPAPTTAAPNSPPLGGRPGPAAIGHDAEMPATQRGGDDASAADVVPRSGKEFFLWLKDVESKRDIGVLKYVLSWGRLQDFPARIVDWDEEMVRFGHVEAVRKMDAIRPIARPAPSPPDPRAGIPEPADPAARFDPADFPEPPDVPGEVGRRQVNQFVWLTVANKDMTPAAITASIRKRDPAGKASYIDELAPAAAADLIRALADRAWKKNFWYETEIGDTVREDFPGLIPEPVEYATKGDAGEVLAAVMDTLGGGTGGAEPVAEDVSTPVEPPAEPEPAPYVMPEMVRDEPKGRKPRKPKAEAEPEPTAIESQV